MKDVIERTDGALRFSPSSLYASIRRLLENGLIEELDERPDPEDDDERRRYYRLTRLGRAVATAEARRLERLLVDARATGLLPRKG
jgi:DNA-binding PadR family transcriptional regulator